VAGEDSDLDARMDGQVVSGAKLKKFDGLCHRDACCRPSITPRSKAKTMMYSDDRQAGLT